MVDYKSKTVIVNRTPMSLFNSLTDLESVKMAIPEDKRNEVQIDGNRVKVTYANFVIAVELKEKVPFSKVVFVDVEAPFHFIVTFNLTEGELVSRTSFNIEVSADLNFMMKTLLSSKIQEVLDKTVDAIATGEFIR